MRTSSFFASSLVLALACAVVSPASARVFKCKGADGAIVFQDSECAPGSQSLQRAASGTGPAVDLTQAFEKRFKTPEERERVMAALKIAGLEMGMRKSIEVCKTHGTAYATGIQQVYDEWRNQHIIAITTSDKLIERYTTTRERADGFTEISSLLDQAVQLRAGNDPVRSQENCKNAPLKIRSFLTHRNTEIYSVVNKAR
jgi:hypothetical protein